MGRAVRVDAYHSLKKPNLSRSVAFDVTKPFHSIHGYSRWGADDAVVRLQLIFIKWAAGALRRAARALRAEIRFDPAGHRSRSTCDRADCSCAGVSN